MYGHVQKASVGRGHRLRCCTQRDAQLAVPHTGSVAPGASALGRRLRHSGRGLASNSKAVPPQCWEWVWQGSRQGRAAERGPAPGAHPPIPRTAHTAADFGLWA